MNQPLNQPLAETRSVVVERELPFPPEKIWRALTQPHLIEEWLMKNDFMPVVGHRFNLQRSPQPDVNIAVDCRVLEIEPHKTLSYSWDAYGLESVVTWTLTRDAHGDPSAHGAVGLPARSAAGLWGRHGRVAAVPRKPRAGLGAHRLKAQTTD